MAKARAEECVAPWEPERMELASGKRLRGPRAPAKECVAPWESERADSGKG